MIFCMLPVPRSFPLGDPNPGVIRIIVFRIIEGLLYYWFGRHLVWIETGHTAVLTWFIHDFTHFFKNVKKCFHETVLNHNCLLLQGLLYFLCNYSSLSMITITLGYTRSGQSCSTNKELGGKPRRYRNFTFKGTRVMGRVTLGKTDCWGQRWLYLDREFAFHHQLQSCSCPYRTFSPTNKLPGRNLCWCKCGWDVKFYRVRTSIALAKKAAVLHLWSLTTRTCTTCDST